MHQKTALVTGGAKRLGASICEYLAAQGFNIALQFNASEHEARQFSEQISKDHGNCAIFQADLTQREGAQALFKAAAEKFGQIDLLVNNASIFEDDTPQDAVSDMWDAHFDIHLRTPSLLTAAMANQENLKHGLVVNMIDQRVRRLTPNFYSYTLSKSALWTATQTLAQIYAPKLRINGIGPGPSLQNSRQSAEDFQKQIDGLILKRGPALEEFGRTIYYLWQNRSITGQMIALDGGQHLAWETPDVAGIAE